MRNETTRKYDGREKGKCYGSTFNMSEEWRIMFKEGKIMAEREEVMLQVIK